MTDPFRKKMKNRHCRVELTDSKSTPYHVDFIGFYRAGINAMGGLDGTKITVASHRCRYAELQNIIDEWISNGKLPSEP